MKPPLPHTPDQHERECWKDEILPQEDSEGHETPTLKPIKRPISPEEIESFEWSGLH